MIRSCAPFCRPGAALFSPSESSDARAWNAASLRVSRNAERGGLGQSVEKEAGKALQDDARASLQDLGRGGPFCTAPLGASATACGFVRAPRQIRAAACPRPASCALSARAHRIPRNRTLECRARSDRAARRHIDDRPRRAAATLRPLGCPPTTPPRPSVIPVPPRASLPALATPPLPLSSRAARSRARRATRRPARPKAAPLAPLCRIAVWLRRRTRAAPARLASLRFSARSRSARPPLCVPSLFSHPPLPGASAFASRANVHDDFLQRRRGGHLQGYVLRSSVASDPLVRRQRSAARRAPEGWAVGAAHARSPALPPVPSWHDACASAPPSSFSRVFRWSIWTRDGRSQRAVEAGFGEQVGEASEGGEGAGLGGEGRGEARSGGERRRETSRRETSRRSFVVERGGGSWSWRGGFVRLKKKKRVDRAAFGRAATFFLHVGVLFSFSWRAFFLIPLFSFPFPLLP